MTKILVVGVGAVGGLYSAKIWQAGAEVCVVCRSDYESVKANGIEIRSIWGDFNFKPNRVLRSVDEFVGEVDFIIIATKVLPQISLPKLIAPVVSSKTSIVLIQNGVFIEHDLARYFSHNHLLSVIAFVATQKEREALVEHSGDGKLIIGEYQNSNQEKTNQLIELWQSVGVPCFLSNDIQFDRWKKLLWNASFNPISVIAGGLDTKQILDDPKLRKLVKDVMLEVKLVAMIDGYEISEELIDNIIADTAARKVPGITSMLLDFRANRQMEIEAILGNALRFAQEKKLDLPLMQRFYDELSTF